MGRLPAPRHVDLQRTQGVPLRRVQDRVGVMVNAVPAAISTGQVVRRVAGSRRGAFENKTCVIASNSIWQQPPSMLEFVRGALTSSRTPRLVRADVSPRMRSAAGAGQSTGLAAARKPRWPRDSGLVAHCARRAGSKMQRSAISNQQSVVNNQQSAISGQGQGSGVRVSVFRWFALHSSFIIPHSSLAYFSFILHRGSHDLFDSRGKSL
jgi:hypothetical protein